MTALADAGSTNILAQYEYGPFGELLRATGPMAKANPFRFSTKYQDDETDLVCYLHRFYSPSTGRWLSRDPIDDPGFILLQEDADLGGEASLNAFYFVGNDPIDGYDFLGLTVGADEIWDFINISIDVVSLWGCVKGGEVAGAFLDTGGLAFDVTAAVVPFVPGGAGAAIKTWRLSRSSRIIVGKMLTAARAVKGADRIAHIKVLRWTVVKGDAAHHIIAETGANSLWLKGTLKKQMDALRARATRVGFDINAAENGVALPSKFHKNLDSIAYYQRVLEAFKNAKKKEDFLRGTDKLAEELLRESGKLR